MGNFNPFAFSDGGSGVSRGGGGGGGGRVGSIGDGDFDDFSFNNWLTAGDNWIPDMEYLSKLYHCIAIRFIKDQIFGQNVHI